MVILGVHVRKLLFIHFWHPPLWVAWIASVITKRKPEYYFFGPLCRSAESCEYFCQTSSKSIFIIFSCTVSMLLYFFETQCTTATTASECCCLLQTTLPGGQLFWCVQFLRTRLVFHVIYFSSFRFILLWTRLSFTSFILSHFIPFSYLTNDSLTYFPILSYFDPLCP